MKEKSTLTLRVKSRTLGEHRRAFDNVNNPNGFPPEVNVQLDPTCVGAILLEITNLSSITKTELMQRSRQLQSVVKGMKYHQAQTLLARTLGYESASEMGQHWEATGRLRNKRLDRPKRTLGQDLFGTIQTERFNLSILDPNKDTLPSGFELKDDYSGEDHSGRWGSQSPMITVDHHWDKLTKSGRQKMVRYLIQLLRDSKPDRVEIHQVGERKYYITRYAARRLAFKVLDHLNERWKKERHDARVP